MYYSLLRYRKGKIKNAGNLKRAARRCNISNPLGLLAGKIAARVEECKRERQRSTKNTVSNSGHSILPRGCIWHKREPMRRQWGRSQRLSSGRNRDHSGNDQITSQAKNQLGVLPPYRSPESPAWLQNLTHKNRWRTRCLRKFMVPDILWRREHLSAEENCLRISAIWLTQQRQRKYSMGHISRHLTATPQQEIYSRKLRQSDRQFHQTQSATLSHRSNGKVLEDSK